LEIVSALTERKIIIKNAWKELFCGKIRLTGLSWGNYPHRYPLFQNMSSKIFIIMISSKFIKLAKIKQKAYWLGFT
jgi:hypothetical protein